MSESRNPFARRDGRIITINDLNDNENGLKCGCECPICGGTFVARMGEIRAKHFAHSGEPCDAEKQLINSAYQVLYQALTERGYFYYPALFIYYNKEQKACSYYDTYKIRSYPAPEYEKIFDIGKIDVKELEIVSDSSGVAIAIIINSVLAVKLSIETIYCVSKHDSRYEDLATLNIDFDDSIYKENIELLSHKIIAETISKRWIYSPRALTFLAPKEEIREAEYQKYIEEINRRREEEERERKLQRKEQERLKAEEEERKRVIEQEKEKERQKKEEEFKKIIASGDIPQDYKLCDPDGIHYVKCKICNRIMPESEIGSYGGGDNKENLGTCDECLHKIRIEEERKRAERKEEVKPDIRFDPNICPECGGTLKEKYGRYGYFIGCSNYPRCDYIKKNHIRRY